MLDIYGNMIRFKILQAKKFLLLNEMFKNLLLKFCYRMRNFTKDEKLLILIFIYLNSDSIIQYNETLYLQKFIYFFQIRAVE